MLGRRFSLGELQADQAAERGEFGVRPSFGLPPAGNVQAPAAGTQGMNIAVSNDQSSWAPVQFTVGTTAVRVQEALFRKFLLLMNKDGAETLYFGFGWVPTVTNGLPLTAGQGFEPFRYPINEIWVLASAANVTGLIIYGT